MIKLSIVIPLYKASGHVNRLVRTLNDQTYKDFEVVFVDDASPDNTLEVLNDMLREASFKYCVTKLEKNAGPGNARNVGVQMSIGEWCAFIDADDTLNEIYCSALMERTDEKVQVVISSAYKEFEDGRLSLHYDLKKLEEHKEDKKYLVCNLDFAPWGKIFRRSLWIEKKLSFPSGIRGEDGAVIPLLYYHSDGIAFAEDAIYYYRQTNNSRSRSDGRYFNDIYEACLLLEKKLPDREIMEYKYVRLVGYGVVMNAILHKEPNLVLKKYCDILREKYPNGIKNKYWSDIDWRKRFFIKCSYLGCFFIQRMLVSIAK